VVGEILQGEVEKKECKQQSGKLGEEFREKMFSFIGRRVRNVRKA